MLPPYKDLTKPQMVWQCSEVFHGRNISFLAWFFVCFVLINRQNSKRDSPFCEIFCLLVHHIFHCKIPKRVVLQALLFSPHHVFFNIYFFNIGKTTLLVIWSLHAAAKTDRIHVKLILCFLVYLFAFPKLSSSWVSEEQEHIWSGVHLIQPKSFGFKSTPFIKQQRKEKKPPLWMSTSLIYGNPVQCSQSPFSMGVYHKCSSSKRIAKSFLKLKENTQTLGHGENFHLS